MRIFHKVARADHSIFPRKKYKIVISWQAPTLICQANYLWPYTLKEPARPIRQRPVSPKADRVTSPCTCHLWSLCDHVSLVWWSLPLQTWPSLGLHLSGLGPPPVWQFVQFLQNPELRHWVRQADPSQDSISVLVWFAPVFPPSHFIPLPPQPSHSVSQPINKLSNMVRKLINLLKYLNLFQNSWWLKWAKVLPEPHF